MDVNRPTKKLNKYNKKLTKRQTQLLEQLEREKERRRTMLENRSTRAFKIGPEINGQIQTLTKDPYSEMTIPQEDKKFRQQGITITIE